MLTSVWRVKLVYSGPILMTLIRVGCIYTLLLFWYRTKVPHAFIEL